MIDLDQQLLFWLYRPDASGVVLAFWVALTVVGSGWSMLGLTPLLALRRTRNFGQWMAAALVTNAALVAALKATIGRTRPCRAMPAVKALVFAAPTDCSLPSGHSAGMFCLATFVVVCAWRGGFAPGRLAALGGTLFPLAAAVAASRVALGVHWPADVAAGAAVGAAMGALFAWRARWPWPSETRGA